MFISKKHLSRRTLLKGAGVSLGTASARRDVSRRDRVGSGGRGSAAAILRGLRSSRRGAGLLGSRERRRPLPAKLPFIWTPLEPYRDNLTLLTGLHATSSEPPPGETGADHWVAAAFLCADKPKKTAGADVRAGHTIDQIIAEKIGRETLLPSVEISVEDPGSGSSNCGEGYSCVYTNTIAWASPTTPLPMELNPQVVFERMFGSGSTPEQRVARRERSQSILDAVNGKIATLRQEISVPDRSRLDSFTENVREIERRLTIAASATTAAPEDFAVPPGIPQSFDEHIKLMFDLLALGFQADITRVSTLLFARDLTGRVYPESEAPTLGFHGGSHHGEDPQRINELSKVNQYHVKMLAYFVDKLRKTEDGDGTLLDHSLLLYGSNMGNPNQHLHYDVPHVILGGNHGRMKGGRHLAYPTKTVSTGNLLLSLLDQFDIHQDSIGDSTGPLTNL